MMSKKYVTHITKSPLMNHLQWSEEEKSRLLNLTSKTNQSQDKIVWKTIQHHFPQRTQQQIKSYYHKYMKSQACGKRNHDWSFKETYQLLRARYVDFLRVKEIVQTNFSFLTESIVKSKLQNIKKEAQKFRSICSLIQNAETQKINLKLCKSSFKFVMDMNQFLLAPKNDHKEQKIDEIITNLYGRQEEIQKYLAYVLLNDLE
uniref:Myb-like DNA-binding domain-containing protein n=1 Tax=Trepomonas sp. PC1 TaxID=1076344 RepID=A0A146KBS8_9EUKA|eukprot:JAP94262.1 Myb-like DNA-binding domain-containing protein [Trepomonas sp. PC1]